MLMQSSLHIGEDILLARHGDRISKIKHNRRANKMEAVLVDGSMDSASNTIADMPFSGRLDASDVKFLAKVCLGMLCVLVPLFVAAVAFYADPAHTALLTNMASSSAGGF